MKTNNIDICVNYLTNLDAHYLCIDNVITYHCSYTGSDLDAKWQRITLDEARRLITYKFQPVSINDIIAALQEMDRVYDTAVESDYDTLPTILNLNSKSIASKEEKIIETMFRAMLNQGTMFLTAGEYIEILDKLNCINNIGATRNRVSYIRKYCRRNGFMFREGATRMKLDAFNKVTMICREGVKPPDIDKTNSRIKIDTLIAMIGEKV